MPTQNVMAACSFDIEFTFVWAGWEGTTCDTHNFLEAINNPSIKFPKPPKGKYMIIINCYLNLKYVFLYFFIKFYIIFLLVIAGKYYLVDVGHPNEYGYLGPYKGERYHFQDFWRRGQPPSQEKRFNHAHSLLLNVIERAFGVWKQR